MARKFSVWGKKLGHRQSGSRLLGGVGGAIFFAILAIFAFLLLVGVLTFQILGWSRGTPVYDSGGLTLRLLPIVLLLVVSAYRVSSIVLTMGASAERRGAMVQRASQIRVVSDTFKPQSEYPNIPKCINIMNSPGINLKYRLPIVQLSAWRFLALALLCLSLTGIASALLVTAWSNYQLSLYGWANWLMAAVFSAVAFAAIYVFLWEIMTYSGLGPTCLEISEHPLFPGKTYEIYLSQAGRMKLEKLNLKLVCREEVTYQQGTDIRTESMDVREVPILDQSTIRIDPDLPYETKCEFLIPVDVMHSFQSSHNMITWMIEVDGDMQNWPGFQRKFPVVVYPKFADPEYPSSQHSPFEHSPSEHSQPEQSSSQNSPSQNPESRNPSSQNGTEST